jgi:hypothetical protein
LILRVVEPEVSRFPRKEHRVPSASLREIYENF